MLFREQGRGLVRAEAGETDSVAQRPLASLRVLAVGYGVLTISLLAIGLLLTDVLDRSVGRWDIHVNRWFVTGRTGSWNSVTAAATFMLNTAPVIVVALAVVGLLIWRHRLPEALIIAFGLTLEIAVFLSVTFVVARPRPDVPRLNATPATWSYPSGHAAAALVLYGGIALVLFRCTRATWARVLASVVATAAVVAVALSRVYRGMHHPTDVVAGAAFGIVCLWFAVLAVRAGFEQADLGANEDTPKIGGREVGSQQTEVVA